MSSVKNCLGEGKVRNLSNPYNLSCWLPTAILPDICAASWPLQMSSSPCFLLVWSIALSNTWFLPSLLQNDKTVHLSSKKTPTFSYIVLSEDLSKISTCYPAFPAIAGTLSTAWQSCTNHLKSTYMKTAVPSVPIFAQQLAPSHWSQHRMCGCSSACALKADSCCGFCLQSFHLVHVTDKEYEAWISKHCVRLLEGLKTSS